MANNTKEIELSNDQGVVDLLDRSSQIESLIKYISGTRGPSTIAVDGGWGTGKTTFLELLKPHLESREYTVVPINAWETMLTPDPLMPIILALQESDIALKAGRHDGLIKTLGTLAAYIAPVFGRFGHIASAFALSQQAQSTPFEAHKKAYEDYEKYKAGFDDAIGDENPTILCIDELDRCRPEYAVSMLEAVYHCFRFEGVLIILGANVGELSKSIYAVYGPEFDGRTYIRRLIDHRFPLRAGDRHGFVYSFLEGRCVDRTIVVDGYSRRLLDRFVVASPYVSPRDIRDGIDYVVRALRGGDDSADQLKEFRVPQRTIAMTMAVLRMVSIDVYVDMNGARASDLEVLMELNRIGNRSDDWWMDSEEGYDVLCDVVMEAVLVGWHRFTTGNWTKETPLLRNRRREAEAIRNSYPSMVVTEADNLAYTFGYDFADARSMIEDLDS